MANQRYKDQKQHFFGRHYPRLKTTLLPLPDVYDIVFNKAERLALETNPLLFTDPKRVAKLQVISSVKEGEVKEAVNRQLRKKS